MGAPGLIPLSQSPPSCPPSDLQSVPRVQLPGELGFLVPKRSQLNQFPPAATGLLAAPAGPCLRDALLDGLLALSFLLNFGTTMFCCFRNQKDRNSYGDVWKMEATTTKKITCKAFFLHVSYCISKDPLPIFYEKNLFFFCATVDTINGALKSMTSTFQKTFFNVILTV